MDTRAAQNGSSGPWRGAAVLLVFVAGCAGGGRSFDRAFARSEPPSSFADPTLAYAVRCPDVLEIAVAAPANWNGTAPVRPDGRIELKDAGRPRVEGLTTAAVGRVVAEAFNVPVGKVTVKVAEFASRQVYLYGEVRGDQRVVAYKGPETVVDLLQRVGGVTPGAAPKDIQVVRDNVAEGGPPEIFHVNLEAIFGKNDARSNVVLEPFDQVFVGQSRRSAFARAFPPWFRNLCGQGRKDAGIMSPSGSAPERLPSNPHLLPENLPAPTPLSNPLRIAAQ